MQMMPQQLRNPVLGALALCLALCGCAGDGLERHQIKGKVTFGGKPVESGAIFFEPTLSAGRIAPTVYLPVRGGAYDTGVKGPVSGKYRVIVGGIDAASKRVDDDGITHTSRLFEDHVFEVDIPPPNNTLDVDVPAARAAKQP
jgi:hypothetical protein